MPRSRKPTAAAAGSSGWRSYAGRNRRPSRRNSWLPDETVAAFREYLVGIKEPLTTPIGGGIRSLNVALRQLLDLYVCLRPVRWFEGRPVSGSKRPEKVDMVIFRRIPRTSTPGSSSRAAARTHEKVLAFLKDNFPKSYSKVRFPATTAVGLKPVSSEGSERLIRAAILYALTNGAPTSDASSTRAT